ncbi:MAG: hypothetical protein ABIF92_02015 [archaeon]
MNKKTALFLVVLIFLLMTVSAVSAARTTTASSSSDDQGIGGRILDSIVCLFQCGWPAWILLLLPPIAVWFYTRFIHVF